LIGQRIIGLVILNAIIYLGEVAMLLMSLLADRALYRVAQVGLSFLSF
jgi:hypothetical protein